MINQTIVPRDTKRSRYGQSLRQTTLRERYEKQILAPDLLSVRDEVSLLDARLNDLLSKIDSNALDFESILDSLQNAFTWLGAGDLERTKQSLDVIKEVVERGILEVVIWKEAYAIIEQRRKLVETEMKTIQTIGSMISTDQMMLLVNKMVAAMTLRFKDQEALALFKDDLDRIFNMVPHPSTNGFRELDSI